MEEIRRSLPASRAALISPAFGAAGARAKSEPPGSVARIGLWLTGFRALR